MVPCLITEHVNMLPFASPVYRELAYKMIEKLAQHYGNDSRIIGWHAR